MSKDVLAKGAKRAQFGGPSGISQDKWDNIFADWTPEVEYEVKKKNSDEEEASK